MSEEEKQQSYEPSNFHAVLDEESLSSPALPTIGIFDYNPKKQKQKNRWSISSIENDTNLASANERLKIIVKEQREALDKMSRDNLNLKHEIIRLQSILLATNKIQAPERPLPELTSPSGRSGSGSMSNKIGTQIGMSLNEAIAKAKKENDNNNSSKSERFKKYKKMHEMGIELQSILNKMKLDGCNKEELNEFEKIMGNNNNNENNNKNNIVNNKTYEEESLEYNLIPMPNYKPSNNMKKIHWEIIDAKNIKNTVWQELNRQPTITFNTKNFELSFQYRHKKPRLNQKQGGNINKIQSKQQKKGSIKFVARKRDELVQIGLKKINLNDDEIHNAIITLNDNILNDEKLKLLSHIIPDTNEKDTADQFASKILDAENGDMDSFGRTEQFFIKLSDIEELQLRIELWQFQRSYIQEFENKQNTIQQIIEGLNCIRKSESFRLFLQIILTLGNYMNSGSIKARAFGFQLNDIKQLSAVKDLGGKMTFIMYVYEFAMLNYKEKALLIFEELSIEKESILSKISKIESIALTKSIIKMSNLMSEINDTCLRLGSDYIDTMNENDKFIIKMKHFYNQNNKSIFNLTAKLENILTQTRNTAKYFGFNLNQTTPIETFFQTIYTFISMLEKACQDLQKLKNSRNKKK